MTRILNSLAKLSKPTNHMEQSTLTTYYHKNRYNPSAPPEEYSLSPTYNKNDTKMNNKNKTTITGEGLTDPERKVLTYIGNGIPNAAGISLVIFGNTKPENIRPVVQIIKKLKSKRLIHIRPAKAATDNYILPERLTVTYKGEELLK